MAVATAVIERDGLDALIQALMADGYRVVGPTVRDGTIVLAELESPDQLGRVGSRGHTWPLPAPPA